jgi:hypothetical protein
MLFVSAGGSKAAVRVVDIGDTAGALHVSIAAFELGNAKCYDPNEVSVCNPAALFCIRNRIYRAALCLPPAMRNAHCAGTAAAGGHRGGAGGSFGVRACDPRAVDQPGHSYERWDQDPSAGDGGVPQCISAVATHECDQFVKAPFLIVQTDSEQAI